MSDLLILSFSQQKPEGVAATRGSIEVSKKNSVIDGVDCRKGQ